MATDEIKNNPNASTQGVVKAESPCPPGMVYNEETGQCEQPGGGGEAGEGEGQTS